MHRQDELVLRNELGDVQTRLYRMDQVFLSLVVGTANTRPALPGISISVRCLDIENASINEIKAGCAAAFLLLYLLKSALRYVSTSANALVPGPLRLFQVSFWRFP